MTHASPKLSQTNGLPVQVTKTVRVVATVDLRRMFRLLALVLAIQTACLVLSLVQLSR